MRRWCWERGKLQLGSIPSTDPWEVQGVSLARMGRVASQQQATDTSLSETGWSLYSWRWECTSFWTIHTHKVFCTDHHLSNILSSFVTVSSVQCPYAKRLDMPWCSPKVCFYLFTHFILFHTWKSAFQPWVFVLKILCIKNIYRRRCRDYKLRILLATLPPRHLNSCVLPWYIRAIDQTIAPK